jgi:small-conductance mechanosensitive channel
MTRLIAAMIAAGAILATAWAQEPAFSPEQVSSVAPADQKATLMFANRPIVELRAIVFGRMPAERAASAKRVLDELVEQNVTSPVSTRTTPAGILIVVGRTDVFGVVPADVDLLAGATLKGTAMEAAVRLHSALAEAVELRAPGRLLRATAEAIGMTVVLGLVLWLLRGLNLVVGRRLRSPTSVPAGVTWSEAWRLTHIPRALQWTVTFLLGATALVLSYFWLAFVLRRFPYTRPWGESLRSTLLEQLESLGAQFVDALPGLFAIVVIVVAVRATAKAIGLLFNGIEQGRLAVPGVYPDTAAPTRRLITGALWMCALAMIYPYVPGAESPGFKGISVFVGLVLSLGSTGVVQHLMSGLMVTFSRAVHVGDFARVGGIDGTVEQIGALAMKLRTPYGEEVTVPHAVVVAQMTTNYSTRGGAYVPTTVTIGYDTSWRQVEGLLLTAAERTEGIRSEPPPVVWRAGLEDYYVKYTLLVAPERPSERSELLDRLHARILDAFNEQGVQIMSPHYNSDPAAPKIVPPVSRPDDFTSPRALVPVEPLHVQHS